MKAEIFRSRLGFAAYLMLAVLSMCHVPTADAQDADLRSAAMQTCNIKGSVRITVAGVVSSFPLSCLNPTAQTSPGSDDSALVGIHTQGVPGIANVLSISAPFGLSDWSDSFDTTLLTGEAGAAQINLIQDAIRADSVAGRLSCATTTSNPSLTLSQQAICEVAMTIGSLHIAGQQIQLPQEPIALNTPVAVTGINVRVQPLGLPVLNVPLSGQLVLNQVKITGVGTPTLRIEHAPMAGTLEGQVNVIGIGVVKVEIAAEGHEAGDWQKVASAPFQTPVLTVTDWD